MRNLLIPVDGRSAQRTANAVAEAIAIHRQEPVGVHLLSVQPRLSGHAAMCFSDSTLHALQHEAGTKDLAPAQALLDQAGVPWSASVAVGRSAETIARQARELGCDRIVMGRENRETLASRVLGSVASQVRQILGRTADCQVLGS
ncbi:MAG: universal stress protein [Rubrivivax sp.]|nr:universal stress protein [Rubrivivax sp.]